MLTAKNNKQRDTLTTNKTMCYLSQNTFVKKKEAIFDYILLHLSLNWVMFL